MPTGTKEAWPGLGWTPDIPDPRDLHVDSECVRQALHLLEPPESQESDICLREYFAPIDEGCATADSAAVACTAVLEYFHRRCLGDLTRLSSQFVDGVTRRALKANRDGRVSIRSVWKAIARAGVPPEYHVPIGEDGARLIQDPFLFSFRADFADLVYFRVEVSSGENRGLRNLQLVKALLQGGIPCAFGFAVPSYLSRDPCVEFRRSAGGFVGGTAAVAAGYSDHSHSPLKGALLFRSPWGKDWGDEGYGWLPYEMVLEGLACDFWAVIRPLWLESGELTRPEMAPA